tara:strand:+ start:2730 stop:3008 length:279 start_codon:yes stop_codon:yes gene_type:complete
VISLFKKRKRLDGPDEQQMAVSMAALSRNEHFKIFMEHLHERRERSIRSMQMESVVKCSNRHFMESGKLEALDELLDDLAIMSNAEIDKDSI